MHGVNALASAPASEDSAPAPVAPGQKAGGRRHVEICQTGKTAAAALPASLLPPATTTDFATLQSEYAAWYVACQLRAERKGELAYYLKRLTQGQAIYQQVGTELNIPWVFIGITHGMECGFNFKAHLHNGDPLSARTVQVPKGRPATGNPPFTWSQSARDALIYKGYHQVTDWSVPHMLHL